MIQTSTDPTLKCPHDNCGMVLEERELRGVRIKDYSPLNQFIDISGSERS